MGAFEMTTIEATATTAKREESRMKFTGGFLSAIQRMAGFGDTVRITRLDRDVVWTLDLEKKTYTESPLTAKAERERPVPGQRPKTGKEKEEASDWVVTRNEFRVEKTGASKTINGFPCEEYLMTWTVETRNVKTAETGKSLMTNHLWTTPVTDEIRAAQAEEHAYGAAYLKKIGMGMTPAEAQRYLAGLNGLSDAEQQKALAHAAAEMAKVQGFTIVSQLEWSGEGGPRGDSRSASSGQGSGGSGDLGQALGRLFGGGKNSSESASSGPGGSEKAGAIFSFYTEVKSIRASAADPVRFEIPAGYTLKK
jgi:hypothetical protein